MTSRYLLVLLALPLWAQFSEIGVTDDGRQVYFSTPLTMAGDSRVVAYPESRIYKWTAGGVELVAERGALTPTGPTISSGSGDGAGQLQVSSDGSRYAFTLHNVCPKPAADGAACDAVGYQAELRGSISASLGPGSIQLSRSGRYALVIPPPAFGRTAVSALFIDIQNITFTSVPAPPFDSVALASDGSVLTPTGVWRAGTVTPFGITVPFRPLALSDNGQVFVFDRVLTDAAGRINGVALVTRNLASGTEATIFAPPPGTPQVPFFMGVSADGSKVLYRVTDSRIEGTAYLADTAAGSNVRIPLVDGELASYGALNGAGDTLVVATSFHRLVKVGFAGGSLNSSQVIVPTTPYTSVPLLSPGSMTRLAAPVPPGVDGQILLDGKPVPVLSSTSDQFVIQVPWEQRVGSVPLVLDYPTQSPFRQNQTAMVAGLNPYPVMADAGTYPVLGLKMVKGDFSALVTTTPSPGDIVHTWFTGLGRVEGDVQTGVAAPTASLRPIASSMRCYFTPLTTPAETLFAGLAPGLIGLYQVTFRFPYEPITQPLNGMRCSVEGPDGSASFGFIYAPLGTP